MINLHKVLPVVAEANKICHLVKYSLLVMT